MSSGRSIFKETVSGGVSAPQVKVSLKNTFINVDDGSSGELSMPDLLRARTTPAALNALQALYLGAQAPAPAYVPPVRMESVIEQDTSANESEGEAPPPEFNAEDVLRQLSELTETLSAMNYDGVAGTSPSLTSPERLPSPAVDNTASTTVMLRNIPNKYSAVMLMEELLKFGFGPKDIDFFYLPIDFRNVCNVGFAFFNFRGHVRAEQFMHAFEGYRLPATNSSKICTTCWARIQGKEANIAHYKDSPIAPEYRPWLFSVQGERETFPEPDAAVLAAIEKSAKEATRATNATKGPDENKIFVGGLSRDTSGQDLVEYFKKFGAVRDAAVVIDRTSGKSRGFGFCLFERYVPRKVLSERHVIDGSEVAVKMYQDNTVRGGRANRM
jgi:hypothetical protein